MGRLENRYKAEHLIPRLEEMFPECLILHNDSGYRQGIPDLLILWHDHWAFLEVKRESKAEKRPNQEWYINLAQEMSFGAIIYPENEDEVLHDLQQAFSPRRRTRPVRR